MSFGPSTLFTHRSSGPIARNAGIVILLAMLLVAALAGPLTSSAQALSFPTPYRGTVGGYSTYATNCNTVSGGYVCPNAYQKRLITQNGVGRVYIRYGTYGNVYGRVTYTPSTAWMFYSYDLSRR